MAQKHIKIPIPNWFPDAEDARVLLGRIKGKYMPFHCVTCDATMNFKNPDFVADVHEKRIGMHNSSKHSFCASCLSVEIAKVFATGTGVEVAKCYCCENTKDTVDVIWGLDNDSSIDVRFLTRWWNGNPLCLECIQTALQHSTETGSFIKYHRGKSYYVNSKGGLIRV